MITDLHIKFKSAKYKNLSVSWIGGEMMCLTDQLNLKYKRIAADHKTILKLRTEIEDKLEKLLILTWG